MERILFTLLWIYVAASQIMALVFLVDIIKEWDNTLLAIILGPIVAELKGIFWIFFI